MQLSDPYDIEIIKHSYLAKGGLIKGELYFSGIVHLSSSLEGALTVEESGRLIIEREGAVKGSIRAGYLEIFGTFEGEIYSKGIVIIRPSARVIGSINCDKIVIYPGALLNLKANTGFKLGEAKAELLAEPKLEPKLEDAEKTSN